MKYLFTLQAIILYITLSSRAEQQVIPRPTTESGRVQSILESRAEYQWTSLHWAARHGDLEEVRQLARMSGQREARDVQGRTPLHIAALAGHRQIVEALLDAGADVNARDQWGITPLRRMELIRDVRGWNRSDIKELLRQHGGTT